MDVWRSLERLHSEIQRELAGIEKVLNDTSMLVGLYRNLRILYKDKTWEYGYTPIYYIRPLTLGNLLKIAFKKYYFAKHIAEEKELLLRASLKAPKVVLFSSNIIVIYSNAIVYTPWNIAYDINEKTFTRIDEEQKKTINEDVRKLLELGVQRQVIEVNLNNGVVTIKQMWED